MKNIFKKITTLFAVVALISVFTGCGESNKLIETAYLEAGPENYVSIPEDYLNFSYKEPEVEITDEMVSNNIELLLRETGVETPNNEGEIKSGDKINITYEAKDKEGNVIYSNTTGYDITIDEGYMTEALNEALKGHKVGDKVEVTDKISEDYTMDESLRGVEVTYTITINSKSDITYPEFSDEWVKENSDCETMDEFRDYTRKQLEETYYENALDDIFSEYWTDLMEKVEVLKDFPEDILKDEAMYFQGYVYNYGYAGPGDDMETLAEEYAQDAAKMKMALYLIASENNLIPTETEFKEYCAEEIATKNYDEESFEKTFGFTPYEYGIKYGWAEDMINSRVEKLVLKIQDEE